MYKYYKNILSLNIQIIELMVFCIMCLSYHKMRHKKKCKSLSLWFKFHNYFQLKRKKKKEKLTESWKM